MESDLDLMEASLAMIGDGDIRAALFARFFAAFPEERTRFLNLDAASRRMTNETIDAMLGLAGDQSWVPSTVTYFVDLHRNYGVIPAQHYADFVDMVVATLAEAADESWTFEIAAAWGRQAGRLKAMLCDEHASQLQLGLLQF